MFKPLQFFFFITLSISANFTIAQLNQDISHKINTLSDNVESKVIEWRRHFHENPELSNREFKTAERIAKHLKSLGLEVKTGVAHTGVVAILKGGKPGPVIGLRADIDALPVTERVDIPFASKVKTTYNHKEVGVMHACGHDTHIAIMMGVAEVLTKMKADLKGTIKFIFQPAEEGAPIGEEGGAALMIKEGVLENPKVDAIFGLHINSQLEVNKIAYKPKGALAAVNGFTIKVKGKQTHGSTPWTGVDPIVASAQIIMGLQTIISRQSPLTKEAAVISVGIIEGGVRSNIIPEEVNLTGTIRTLDYDMQKSIIEKIKRTATSIASSSGATAEVNIRDGIPITYNNPELTNQMLPTLQRVAGLENVTLVQAITGSEDFAFYSEKIPGFFFFLGGMPKGKKASEAGPHHTPSFFIDESGMKLGVKTFCNMVIDYGNSH